MSQLLFDATDEIEQRISEAPHVLLCLNYDGALANFSDMPLGAHLSPQMERVLLSLTEHKDLSLAIFTGRDRTDLQGRIAIPRLIFVGNHGLEISGPGFMFVEPAAAARVDNLRIMSERLAYNLEDIPGVRVDCNGLTISVHTRQVAPARCEEARQIVQETLASTVQPLVLNTDEEAFEISPRVYWNKASAVGWIRERLNKPDTLTIYVGNDVADEEAFFALWENITVKVGDQGETAARFRLSGPPEVRKFLEWLDDLFRHHEWHEMEAVDEATKEKGIQPLSNRHAEVMAN